MYTTSNPSRRTDAVAVSQLGIVLGPLVGGALTEYSTWRWCKPPHLTHQTPSLNLNVTDTPTPTGFYLNLPAGALVAVFITTIHIPDQIPKPPLRRALATSAQSIDLLGFALFSGATTQLLLALQWGGAAYPWNSAVVIGLLCGAVATTVVFGAWNYRRGDDALIPVSMIRQRAAWSSSLVMMIMMGVLSCNTYFLPIYFQGVQGLTPLMSGVAMLPGIGTQIFAAVAGGVLSKSDDGGRLALPGSVADASHVQSTNSATTCPGPCWAASPTR